MLVHMHTNCLANLVDVMCVLCCQTFCVCCLQFPSSLKMAGKVIVVGGGLSGLSAAHTVLERGGRVLLLDKNSFLGMSYVACRMSHDGSTRM